MEKVYYLNNGKSGESVVTTGLVLKLDKEEGKYETIIGWFIKGKNNKSFLNSYLQGRQMGIFSAKDSFSERIGVLNGGKELSLLESQESNTFDGQQTIYANAYKLSNVILIPKNLNEEESKTYLFEEISSMIEDKYPIPLEDSWKNYFIELIIENSITELTIFGETLPYSKAFYVEINTNNVGHALALAYGRQQFIDKFNRAPQIKSLWKMINPDKFNVKIWQDFITTFGGKEEFEKISETHQETLVYLFEVFQNKTNELREILTKETLDLYSLPLKTTAIGLVKTDKQFSSEHTFKALNIVLSKCKTDRFKALAINAFFDKMTDLDLVELVKRPNELFMEIQGTMYRSRPGGEGIALMSAELWLKEETFKVYEDAYINAMPRIQSSHRTYPTVKGVLDNTDYSYESMDMGNPRGWFVGLETNCCQHLGGAGRTCVQFAAANPEVSGMFRVMKKGETVAQSWFWFNQEKGAFVFDNIEVLGKELRDSIFNCYMKFVEEELVPRANIFGFKTITVGLGCNDVPRLNELERVAEPVTIKSISREHVYSDASNQVFLAKIEENK